MLTTMIFFLFIKKSTAAQNAIIITSPAIVYADDKLKTAIGQIKFKTEVLIGSRGRYQDSVYPIYVASRIAYISKNDLVIKGTKEEEEFLTMISRQEDASKATEHDIQLFKKRYSIHYMAIESGKDLNTSSEIVHEDLSNITAYRFLIEKEFPNQSFIWSLGMAYHRASTTNFETTITTVELNFHRILYKNNFMNCDIFGGIIGSPLFKFKVLQNSESVNSIGYGAQAGIMARFFPNSLFNIELGYQYRHITINKTETITVNRFSISSPSNVGGHSLFAGMGVTF